MRTLTFTHDEIELLRLALGQQVKDRMKMLDDRGSLTDAEQVSIREAMSKFDNLNWEIQEGKKDV